MIDHALPVIVALDHALQAVLRLSPHGIVGIMAVHPAAAHLVGHHHIAAAVHAALRLRLVVAVHLVPHHRAPVVRRVQGLLAGQRDALARVISPRDVGNGGQCPALRQIAVIAQRVGVQHRPAEQKHRSRRRGQSPMSEDTAQALIEDDPADPEGQRRAQHHADDEADVRGEGEHEHDAQNGAAHQRKHHAQHRLQPVKSQRPLGPLRLSDAIQQETERQRQHRRDGAGPAAILRRAVEALVQRKRRRQVRQRVGQGCPNPGVQILRRDVMPQHSQALRAHNQHGAHQQRRPPGARQHAGEHAHRKAVEIDEQQPAELRQQPVPHHSVHQAVGRDHQQIQQEVDQNRRKAQHRIADTPAQKIRLAPVGQRGLQHALPAAEQMPHEHHGRHEAQSAVEDHHHFQIQRIGHHPGGHSRRDLRRHHLRCQGILRQRSGIGKMGKPPHRHHVKRNQKDDHADKQIAPEQKTCGIAFSAAHIHDPPFPG